MADYMGVDGTLTAIRDVPEDNWRYLSWYVPDMPTPPKAGDQVVVDKAEKMTTDDVEVFARFFTGVLYIQNESDPDLHARLYLYGDSLEWIPEDGGRYRHMVAEARITGKPVSLPEPGAILVHDVGDGCIEMSHDGVTIKAGGEEVVHWGRDEWVAGPEAVTATLNAVSLALEYGALAVRARIAGTA